MATHHDFPLIASSLLLHTRDLDKLDEKSERHFPTFKAVRGALNEEPIRFFTDLFQRDGSVLSLLDADHTFVNATLAGPYQRLFDRIDCLVFLAAPDFSVVHRWRSEQEEPLRAAGKGMDDAALSRFLQHYERITRHMLDHMRAQADLLIELDAARAVVKARETGATSPVPRHDPGRPAR